MWGTFALAVLACIAVLYLPGYFAARSIRIDRFAALVVAPAFSLFFAVALGIALEKTNVSCTGFTLFALTLAVGLALFAVGAIARKATGRNPRPSLIAVEHGARTYRTAALYVGAAFVMVLLVFLAIIDGPDSFSRNDDTTVHLSVVRAFLDTGTFSTLSTSSFLAQGGEGGFYPAAWHVVVAIVASFFGNEVSLATNAAIVACTVFVLPLAMCLSLTKLFGDDRRVVLAGAVFTVAFSGFPWGFIVFGQLLPNMLSFMLAPIGLVLLMEAFDTSRLIDKITLAAGICLALGSIAFAQPNGAFTFGILAVLYSVSRIILDPSFKNRLSLAKRLAIAGGIFAVALAAWVALFHAPFMQGVVQYTWKATLSPIEALLCGPLFMFTIRQGVQPFLSILVLVGIICTFKDRKHLWMTIAYLFALMLYVVSVSTDGFLKQLLTGFWYTDYNRTGAMAAFFAIPLAAIGFARLVTLGQTWCAKIHALQNNRRLCAALPVAVLLVTFVACQFFPGHVKLSERRDIYAGPVQIQNEISARYSWNRGLTAEEDAFINEVLETIPENALVINVPSDGSCWSYGVEGINTYFRRSTNTGMGTAEESALLRTQLNDVAASPKVQEVLEQRNARYVLILDDASGENRTTVSTRYKPEDWAGIEAITPETPGFNLVLSEGDMHLYEITAY